VTNPSDGRLDTNSDFETTPVTAATDVVVDLTASRPSFGVGRPASYTATFSTAFATEMIAGQKLSYASGSGAATSNGVIEFGHDGSWKTTTGTASYGGIWNVVNGKLVCVITTGGDHTITYTRLDANANPLNTSASEVAPSAENNPVISIVTFSVMDSAPISTPEVQSQNALKEAFTYLQQVGNTNASEETRMDNANKALGKTIDSYELYPNKYSLLVKASIEGILNKLTDAEETLSKVDVEYPEHSEGKFIKAYLSAKENKDAAEVLKNLKLSMNNDFSGMGEKLWRGFIDKLPAFANFRTTPEYTELLNMKTILYRTAKTNSCKQNKTYYDTRWFGMEIGISHDDKENYLDDPIAVVSFLALFTPEPLPILLGGYLIVESIAINILEKDCGIQLNNTWLNIGFFIPTAQN